MPDMPDGDMHFSPQDVRGSLIATLARELIEIRALVAERNPGSFGQLARLTDPKTVDLVRAAFAHVDQVACEKDRVHPTPIPMQLWCPLCHTRHIDEGEFATKPHKEHACQNPLCCLVWKPAQVPTVGVYDLPGYLNKKPA